MFADSQGVMADSATTTDLSKDAKIAKLEQELKDAKQEAQNERKKRIAAEWVWHQKHRCIIQHLRWQAAYVRG